MNIGTKLVLGVSTMALAIAAVGYYSVAHLERASLNSIGTDLSNQAALAVSEIDLNVYDRLEELRWYAETVRLAEQLGDSNERFDQMPDRDRDQRIESVDGDWTAGKQAPAIDAILDNDLSSELRRHAEYLSRENGYVVFAELYVANKYGTIAGSTGRTSDYLQADESWYQEAITEKTGWIGPVEYDRSSESLSLDIVVPLFDSQEEFSGILKGVLNVEDVQRIVALIQKQSRYRRTRAYLVDGAGKAVFQSNAEVSPTAEHDVPLAEFGTNLEDRPAVAEAVRGGDGFRVFEQDGREILAVFSRSKGYDNRRPLGWTLVVEYDREDVLHDVLVAKRSLMAAWLVATVLAVLGGLWLARSISRPIKKLTQIASDIAAGNFNARVESTVGGDEIARLGETFNEMTRHLMDANVRLARRKGELEVAAVAEEEAHRSLQLQTFALRRSEEQLAEFRRFAEASGQGLGMADLDQQMTYVNPTLCRIIGEEHLEDVLGTTLLDYYPEELRAKLESEVIPTVLREDQWTGELALVTREGKVTPTLENFFLIRDEEGNPSHLADVVTDITERKKAEEALRQSHEELQAIYDGMPDGMLMADVETKRFVGANPAICRMVGYTADELLGMSVMDLHTKKDLPEVLETFRRQAENLIDRAENIPVLRKDGTVFYADIANSAVIYRQGHCIIGFFRDITERKRSEEALQKEREALKHLLEASDRQRQLIAYDIHDGLAQQLAGSIMQLEAAEQLQADHPDQARNSCETGLKMLRQSLSEARRLISGLRPPIIDEMGIVPAIEHMIEGLSGDSVPMIEFSGNASIGRLAPAMENTLFRIVQESLTNACRYSKSDKVRIELSQRDDRIRLVVRDWGIGFDTANVRLGCHGVEGVRQRARALGGHATVESGPKRGTRITVELPLEGNGEETA